VSGTRSTPYVARVMPLYQQRLRAMNAVDFDDLIGTPVLMLSQIPRSPSGGRTGSAT
jgi:superfamily I DNA/RNA helicase